MVLVWLSVYHQWHLCNSKKFHFVLLRKSYAWSIDVQPVREPMDLQATSTSCFHQATLMKTIIYKQWLTADRTTLQDCSMPLHELLDDLLTNVEKMTAHHYIAKHQSQYLRSLKETLEPEDAIMILDFAENYTFIVHDAAQGFHWENSQATLHPFVAYFVDNGQLQHLSMHHKWLSQARHNNCP